VSHDDATDASDDLTALTALCHEVHQPLTYLIASLDSLRHALAGSSSLAAASVLRWIDRASASAEYIGKLVDDAGPVYSVARAQRVDLGVLVDGTLDIVLGEVQRRARLERALSPAVWVFADETRLRQVVLNLVMAAWLSLPDGQADRRRIVVRVERVAARAVVEVEDDGPGLPEELRALGLGLAICKRIVRGSGGVLERHGGDGGNVMRAIFPACDREAA
jgi:two-component system C4-dicarboxylate transport sensor histidine kinase DctB